LLFAGIAWADVPGLKLAGVTYVSLSETAKLLGYSTTDAGSSFTVRSPRGVLVVFADSPDALWTPANGAGNDTGNGEVSFSAPVVKEKGGWYVPTDALELLGVRLQDGTLLLPNGRKVGLNLPQAPPQETGNHSQVVPLGHSVYGLALFTSSSAGPDTVSLLLLDASLLGLAFPDKQNSFDSFMAKVKSGHPLYFVLTAAAESPWDTSPVFSQNGRSFTARYPFTLSVLQGSVKQVSPQAPVSGVVLLPKRVNLRQSLTVQWADAKASFQFRK
jgi:hypothetical protein